MEQVTHALINELQQRKDYLQDEPVETIYFGGGTPSILKASDIEDIISTVLKSYKVTP
jgi:oxygen-independent coproporphyrinogen-3 oxidase